MTYESLPPDEPQESGFAAVHFEPASCKARLEFAAALEPVKAMPCTSRRQRDIDYGIEGADPRHIAWLGCSTDTLRKPDGSTGLDRITLEANFQTSENPPSSDIQRVLDNLGSQVIKYRKFSGGVVDGDMTEEEFATAVDNIRSQVTTEVWEWVELTMRLAGTSWDRDFLPFIAEDLFAAAPPGIDVREVESKDWDCVSGNGTPVMVGQTVANSAYLDSFSDYEMLHRVKVGSPTSVLYRYCTYVDATEQMLIETQDEALRARLAAEGFAVMEKDGWVKLTVEQRRKGVQAPTTPLMRRFSRLIMEASAAGLTPLY